MSARLFGSMGLIISEICTLFNCFGELWAYAIFIKNGAASLLQIIGVPATSIVIKNPWIIMMSVWFLVLQPLSWLKTLDSLKFTSFIAVTSLVFVVVVFIIRFIHPFKPYVHDKPIAFNFRLQMIQSFGNLIFSMACQQNLPIALGEMRGRNLKNCTTSLIFQGIFIALFYSIAGIFGYLCFTNLFDTTPTSDDVLSMYVQKDPLIIASRIGILTTAICCFPLEMLQIGRAHV